MTVKECALNILKKEPYLSNQEVADKVRKLKKNSKTTAGNISYYKSKFKLNKSSKSDTSKNNLSQNAKNKGIEKFKGCYINGSPEGVIAILGAEARNIVQNLFKKQKPSNCEHKDCAGPKGQQLDTCHIGKERLEILAEGIKRSKGKNGYDVHTVLKIFKENHVLLKYPDDIRFLCKKHHTELDKNKTPLDKKMFAEKHLKKVNI